MRSNKNPCPQRLGNSLGNTTLLHKKKVKFILHYEQENQKTKFEKENEEVK